MFYSDEKQMSLDLVTAIKQIFKALVDAGIKTSNLIAG